MITLDSYDIAGIVFAVLVFGLLRLMNWASKAQCSVCAMPWGVGSDEDYKDPITSELVCNDCALNYEGSDYYENVSK
jgi:hypothetical protein